MYFVNLKFLNMVCRTENGIDMAVKKIYLHEYGYKNTGHLVCWMEGSHAIAISWNYFIELQYETNYEDDLGWFDEDWTRIQVIKKWFL